MMPPEEGREVESVFLYFSLSHSPPNCKVGLSIERKLKQIEITRKKRAVYFVLLILDGTVLKTPKNVFLHVFKIKHFFKFFFQ